MPANMTAVSAAAVSSQSPGNSQLTAISKISELHQLRDLYRRDWPAHCVGYYCLSNFIDWVEKRQQLSSVADMKNLQIFTLDNDWQSDGLFLVVDRYQLFVNSLLASEDSGRLTTAIGLLNWTWPGFKVSSFRERHRASVLSVVREKQLSTEYDSLTVMYYKPREEVLQLSISCPAGYVLRPLNAAADADLVDTLWPNHHQGSRFLIRRLIEWNANMGVYTANSGELVAWCLRLQGGFLGALQVKENHKRRGLGSLVAAATARRIAEQGDDVMALVNKDNRASRGMFDKLGFKVVDNCFWLRTFPTSDVERMWPDGE
uniref:Mycothiol acetyltransferase n=1 Tax=Zeugodacus cucurbitae TaxID=28588 RepID=A0A0A1X7X8_ZEUCU